MADVFRQAASLLLLRPAPQRGQEEFPYQLLLLHKPRKRDAWQLPQGGIEHGENVREAALRELEEEAGLRNMQVLAESDAVYQYTFPTSYRRFRPDNVCGQQIRFIIALAPADVAVIVDQKEIDRYLWVYPKAVRQHIRRQEYLQIIDRLCAEAQQHLSDSGS